MRWHHRTLATGTILAWFLFTAAHALHAVPELRDVKVRMAEAQEFQRISEAFTGRENQGRRVILRSQPDVREGLYVFCRFTGSVNTFPEGTVFHLEVLASDSRDIRAWEFPLPANVASRPRLLLGLTGEDWPDPNVTAMAWRLRALDTAGNLLLEHKSFLWEMPREEHE